MLQSFYPLFGLVAMVLLEWAIFTELTPYLRVGFPSTPDVSYVQVASGSWLRMIRTALVATTGIAVGLSFEFKLGWLWLAAVGLFAVAHSFLYVILYKAMGRN
ncbi:MAG: hypothetical protein EBR34_12260 [Sphingomonadaceae bacterium]|nr:hypothetical protein [Sphingomonadaceae bacterium]